MNLYRKKDKVSQVVDLKLTRNTRIQEYNWEYKKKREKKERKKKKRWRFAKVAYLNNERLTMRTKKKKANRHMSRAPSLQ